MAKVDFSLFDLHREPVLAIGARGTIEYMNPAAERFFGGCHTGKRADGLFSSPILEDEWNLGTLEFGGKCATATAGNLDGHRIITVLAPEEAPDAALIASVGRKLGENVGVIGAALDLLERSTGSESASYIANLRKSYFSLMRLKGNIIAFRGGFPSESEAAQSVDLVELVSETVSFAAYLSRDRGVSLRFTTECERLVTLAYGSALERLVLNLISNALKYTPPGGEITVSLRRRARAAYLTVRDNGEGIPRDRLASLFDPGTRVFRAEDPRDGAGLGLAVVRRIAELHSGGVAVDSSPGRGTAVSVSLTLREGELSFSAPKIADWANETPVLTELADVLPWETFVPVE